MVQWVVLSRNHRPQIDFEGTRIGAYVLKIKVPSFLLKTRILWYNEKSFQMVFVIYSSLVDASPIFKLAEIF